MNEKRREKMSAVKEVTQETFEDEVIKSGKPVLVDFFASWCGPCRMLRPVIDEIAAEHPEIKVVSVNIDDAEQLAYEFGISSIPCLVLVEDGREITRAVGYRPKDDIVSMLF